MSLKNYIPILDWLPNYQIAWLKGDVFAGITIGIMLIPQGIAYAIIAGLPPIYGLYTALIPQVVYAFLGTSRQLAIGPAAMDSLIVASGISALAVMGSDHFIVLAVLLAFMIGVFQVAFGMLRLGFLVNFLSKPVISGFTSGSAIIIGINQLGNLLGLKIDRNNKLHTVFLDIIHEMSNIHWPSLILGTSAILLLFLMKKYLKKIPSSLVVVIISIAVVFFFQLNSVGIKTLGDIPKGLPKFQIPNFDKIFLKELSGLALTLALIGFMEAISIAKSVEIKHNNYKVNANKELIAIGFGNIIGSFFQSYASTAGFARTAVNEQSGANTPMSSIIAAGVVAISLLFLTPGFYYLPNTILAAIIIVAAYGLLDFSMPKNLSRFDIRDLIILIATLLTTVFIGIKEGILIGIILSIIMLIYKTTKPNMVILGNVPGTHFYRNVERFDNLIINEEILIFRFDAQLYFANISYFKDKLQTFTLEKGVNLKLIIINGESLNDLDSSAIYALDEILDYLHHKNITVAFTSLKGQVRDHLVKSGLMKKIRYDHCFMSIQEAVDWFEKNRLIMPNKYHYQEYIKQSNR